MIQQLREKGFAALRVQLNGYEDGGTAVDAALDGLLGPPAVVSKVGVLTVWRLLWVDCRRRPVRAGDWDYSIASVATDDTCFFAVPPSRLQ